jgi:hypothetical protein
MRWNFLAAGQTWGVILISHQFFVALGTALDLAVVQAVKA